MRVAKYIYSNFPESRDVFWNKVIARKGNKFDDVEFFKSHVKFNMDKYIDDLSI